MPQETLEDRPSVKVAGKGRIGGGEGIAAAGIAAMGSFALASFNVGWPDVVIDFLRGLGFDIAEPGHVPFYQTVVILIIFAGTTVWLVYALRGRAKD